MQLIRSRAVLSMRSYARAYSAGPKRLTRLFVPTCTADAIAATDTLDSLKLLWRGGYVRQSSSGTYSYLPIGLRILNKMIRIIDEEMEAVRWTVSYPGRRIAPRDAPASSLGPLAQDWPRRRDGKRSKSLC